MERVIVDAETSDNAITLTLGDKTFIFMGENEDFQANELVDYFNDIVYWYYREQN